MDLIIYRVGKLCAGPFHEDGVITIWSDFRRGYICHNLCKGLDDEAFRFDGGAGLMGGGDSPGTIAVDTKRARFKFKRCPARRENLACCRKGAGLGETGGGVLDDRAVELARE